MKYLLLTIVLSIFSVTVSAKCADGYLCKDFLGNTYYNQNGMKHLTERNQRTVGLLSAIAKPAQTNIFANLQQLQAIQNLQVAKTPKPKQTAREQALDVLRSLTREELLSIKRTIELSKQYPVVQELVKYEIQ